MSNNEHPIDVIALGDTLLRCFNAMCMLMSLCVYLCVCVRMVMNN